MKKSIHIILHTIGCLALAVILGLYIFDGININRCMAEESNVSNLTNPADTETGSTGEESKDVKEGPQISSPSAILMEASTGQVIYEKNAEESLHPASITKIMTLNLIFEALEEGKIKLEDEVTVSEYAASMGGSQVFLEAGEKQTVETMIKCISVASANDACVAMAEHISGTEELFVNRMNEKAQELGMTNTHFVNCCGLDTDGHMSSSRDVAIMSRELIIKHPDIHKYSCIWMDTITHTTRKGESEFGLTNTNKLIKQYQWATGLKTGSTGLAKCCLSATANKDGIELIAVIMAAPDSKTRFADAITLLNYGYATCSIYKDEQINEYDVNVEKGKQSIIKGSAAKTFSYMFIDSFSEDDIRKEVMINEKNVAPLKEGDVLGSINYYYKENMIGSVDIISTEEVKEATYMDMLVRCIKKYVCG